MEDAREESDVFLLVKNLLRKQIVCSGAGSTKGRNILQYVHFY